MLDQTSVFNLNVLKQEMIMMTVNEVITALEKAGYNAVNQLVGYILTDDLSYITSKLNARSKLSQYSREEVLLALINGYLGR